MRIFLHSPGHFSPRAFLQRRLPERPPTATKRTLCLTLPSRSPLRVSSPSSSPPMLSSDRLWLLYHRLRFRLRRLWDRFRFFVYETFFGGQSIERMPTELRCQSLMLDVGGTGRADCRSFLVFFSSFSFFRCQHLLTSLRATATG